MKRQRAFRPEQPDALETRVVLSNTSGKISLAHIDRELGIPREVHYPVSIRNPFHAIKISSPGHKNETLGSYVDRLWKRVF